MDTNKIQDYYRTHSHTIQYFNLIGIRDESNPNTWNDKIGYWTSEGEFKLFTGTTDPGVTYTNEPLNPNGCAHLITGFHTNIWKVGVHKGYPALSQYAKCKVWRDKNKNFKDDDKIVEIDHFGINCHRADDDSVVPKVGPYSAGCQVIQNPADWDFFFNRVLRSQQDMFNYLLITKAEFEKEIGIKNV